MLPAASGHTPLTSSAAHAAGQSVGRRALATNTIGDVTYAGALLVVSGFTPTKSAVAYVLELVPTLPEVDKLPFIVADSEQIALSKLQHLPPGVARLPADEALSVALYSYDLFTNSSTDDGSDNFFVQLNERLRLRQAAVVAALRPYLFFLFSALDKLPLFEGTVYRGIPEEALATIQAKYRTGTEVWWSGFTSTSKDLAVAKGFAEQPGGIVFRVTLTDGRRIKEYSAIGGEDEILVRPNTKFHVSEGCHLVTEGELSGYYCVSIVQAAGRFVF